MKYEALLLVFLVVLTAGCASEASAPQGASVVFTENYDLGSYSHTYDKKSSVETAPDGKNFLLFYFTVENKNCPSFEIHQYRLICVVDNVEYHPRTYFGEYGMPDYVKLKPGGKVEGYIVYEIPRKDNIEYTVYYDSPNCPVQIVLG